MSAEYTTRVQNHIFNKEHLTDPSASHEAVVNHPLFEVVSDPSAFFASIESMYTREKQKVKPNTQLKAGIDLSKPSHLRRMDLHTKVHVVTGIVEWGGSNTENIPYWDRQSLFDGFDFVYPEQADQLKIQFDVENINALRAVVGMLTPRLMESSRAITVLEEKLATGTITRSNIDSLIEAKYAAWKVIKEDYEQVLHAKLRHLLYLSDKLPLKSTREFILSEVEEVILQANVSSGELIVNMGVDGGLSEATYRPPYYIVGVRQLEHLGLETVQIPHSLCPDWPFELIVSSMLRNDFSDTYLVEPKEYFLDRRF